MSDLTASVRATVTVEFEVGTWGGGSSFDSLHEQVVREARQKILGATKGTMKIVGEPVISVVTYARKP